MTNQAIMEKLNEIFTDVFDKDITVTSQTTAADIEGWDSLIHITLISEVEDAFGIKFSMKQILDMQNVGEMVDIIQKNA